MVEEALQGGENDAVNRQRVRTPVLSTASKSFGSGASSSEANPQRQSRYVDSAADEEAIGVNRLRQAHPAEDVASGFKRRWPFLGV